MSESNKNELDKLFQSRLSNVDAAENGWNVPPIDLFENAMDALEPQKEDRKPFWFLFLFGGLIIGGLVSMFVYNHIMFDKLDNKIEHLKSHTKELSSENADEVNTSFINSLNSIDPSIKTGSSPIDNTQNLLNNNASKNNQTNVVNNKNIDLIPPTITKRNTLQTAINNNSVNPFNLKNDLGLNSVFAQEPILNNKERAINTFVQNTLLSEQDKEVPLSKTSFTNNIAPIQSLGIDLLKEELTLPILESISNLITPLDLNNISRFESYLLINNHFSSFSMKGDPMENATLTKYDQYCLGYQLGIGLIQNLSRDWALDYSLSYKSLINHSIYNDQTNYNKSNEYLNDYGSLMYLDEMTVVSPTGVFVGNVKIPVNTNEMQDGDLLQNTTNTTQLFHIINASIGLNYTAIRTGNFAFSINSGLGLNYILNAKQDMDTKVYFDDKLMASDTYSMQPSFNGNSLFYSGYAGIGVKYQVTDKLSLALDNRFERSLNSLNTIQSTNAPSTILNSFNTGLKVGYLF